MCPLVFDEMIESVMMMDEWLQVAKDVSGTSLPVSSKMGLTKPQGTGQWPLAFVRDNLKEDAPEERDHRHEDGGDGSMIGVLPADQDCDTEADGLHGGGREL